MSDNKTRKRGNILVKNSKRLEEYLSQKLKIEKEKRFKRVEKLRITKTDKREIRNNDDKKVRTLNNLFQSIADLIFFFEFLKKHPELGESLNDDVEELLGFKAPEVRKDVIFFRLIDSVLAYGNNNLKLHLVKGIADTMINEIMGLGMQKDVNIATNIMKYDLGRIQAWIEFCTTERKNVSTKIPHRKFGF